MSCFTSDPVAAYHMDCDMRDANTEYPLSHEHDECGDCSDCIAERVKIREQVIAALRELAEERERNEQ